MNNRNRQEKFYETETKAMIYDKDIREPLFDFLELQYGKIRLLEEKQMGKSRADIVMVRQDCLTGIEIKSDADTYARLKSQVKDYDRYYDYNIIVAGSTHGVHVKEHVPDWWGIITAEESGAEIDFYVLRDVKQNPSLNIQKKLSILWRPELAHIQSENKMPKYAQKSKKFVISKILHKIPEDILAKQISEELFERDYTKIEALISEYKRNQKSAPGVRH